MFRRKIFSKLLLQTVRLAAAVVLAVTLFSQDARKREDANAIAIRIIIVNSEGEAQKLLDRLKTGDDFGVLAQEKSIDPTANDGGFMGILDPAMLRGELRDALRGVEPGQVSRTVKIPAGYAILKVLPTAEAVHLDEADRARQTAIAAAGSVRYAPDVNGWAEAQSFLAKFSMPDDWGQELQMICESHRQSFSKAMELLENFLDPMNKESQLRLKNAAQLDVMQAYVAKGQLHAYQGEMARAVTEWETAYRIALAGVPLAAPRMEEMLGIGYLHKSEMENGVYQKPGERCLFPMRPEVRYAQTSSSDKAIEYFLKYLEQKPGDLEVKWLLNLAYMTVGKYPAGIPEKYLLPPSSFVSAESVGRFTDVAPQAGLDTFAMAGGTIVDDFDNDGLLDVVNSTYYSCEPMHYFHNNGNGTFTNQAAKAGLSDQLGGLNITQTDYNNDGCPDILVLRGAWQQLGQRKSLLRNNCDGTFTDVTKASGLAKPATNTQAAAWADINNDGLLDLFVGNENGPSQLFVNKGDGTFEDISHSARVDRTAFTKAVVAADYDHDGYVDFYVSNFSSDNFLYHNNHDGTFTDIAKQAGVQGTRKSFAAWFFDYDNDGWPDLFVTSYFVSIEESVQTYLGLPHNAGTLKLYRNMGNGAFRDVTKETALDRVFMPMGSNFGDIDNDGYLDIYLGTGNPSYASLLPNVMLRNQEGKSFVDITTSTGTGDLHKGHGVAFADLDNDGDEDILIPMGGVVPGDRHATRLFENPGNGNDWISLRLVGTKANRAAIGARIKVTVTNMGAGARAIYRTVGSGGSFGSSPLQQHIGLGKSAQIARIEIWWPGGGSVPQTFTNVGKNQFLMIKESAPNYSKLERPQYRLGAANR